MNRKEIDSIMERTVYKTIPLIGIRLIYRDGEYVGWYRPKLRVARKNKAQGC